MNVTTWTQAARNAARQAAEPLVKNSIFLMLASAVSAATGVVFWAVVTRLYPAQNVGIASAVLAAMALLAGFSHLGLSIGLIRFLPETERKGEVVNSSLGLVAAFSCLLALTFLAGLPLWSPNLLFLQRNILLSAAFILFTMGTVMLLIERTAFIALRQSKYVLFQQSVVGLLKVALPLALVSLATFGIVASYGIAIWATIIAFLVVLARLLKDYTPLAFAPLRSIRGLLRFSFGQYVAENLGQLQNFLLPLIVLRVLGAELNAFYYIAYLITIFLFMIPVSVCSSFFAESSARPEHLHVNLRRALKFVLLVLVPAIAIIFFVGDKVLLLFGRQYSEESWEALRLMSLSVLPFTFNEMWITARRVRKEIASVMVAYGAQAALVIGLSAVLMASWGLKGIGLGWLLGQGVVTVFLALIALKRGSL
ncbi:MAG: lipopolysaccharide biosynthesis protein [Chloroflexota bacterium]